jgi:hypothetical protein
LFALCGIDRASASVAAIFSVCASSWSPCERASNAEGPLTVERELVPAAAAAFERAGGRVDADAFIGAGAEDFVRDA